MFSDRLAKMHMTQVMTLQHLDLQLQLVARTSQYYQDLIMKPIVHKIKNTIMMLRNILQVLLYCNVPDGSSSVRSVVIKYINQYCV